MNGVMTNIFLKLRLGANPIGVIVVSLLLLLTDSGTALEGVSFHLSDFRTLLGASSEYADQQPQQQTLCNFRSMAPDSTSYATKFRVHATSARNLVLQMTLYACSAPANFLSRTYMCSEGVNSVCGKHGKSKVLYLWRRSTIPLVVPSHAAFEIGEAVDLGFVVLQVRFAPLLEAPVENVLLFSLKMLSEPTSFKAESVLFSASLPYSISHLSSSSWKALKSDGPLFSDSLCFYQTSMKKSNGPNEMTPFAVFISASPVLWRGAVVYAVSRDMRDIRLVAHVDAKERRLVALLNATGLPGDYYLFSRCLLAESDAYDSEDDEDAMERGPCNVGLMFAGGKDVVGETQKICQEEKQRRLGTLITTASSSPNFLKPTNATTTPQVKAAIFEEVKYEVDWSIDSPLGAINGLAVDETRNLLLVYHQGSHFSSRGSRNRGRNGHLQLAFLVEDPVLVVHAATGQKVTEWGAGLFMGSGGIFVAANGTQVWLTDPKAHVVMMFLFGQWQIPSLVIGVSNKPGRDISHFCGPTAVAVNANEEVFVADGLCNSRIVKLSATGKFLQQWNSQSKTSASQMSSESAPALTLVNSRNWICVAGLGHPAELECFDFNGKPKSRILIAPPNTETIAVTVTSLSWDSKRDLLLGVVRLTSSSSDDSGGQSEAVAFSIKVKLLKGTPGDETELMKWWRDSRQDAELKGAHCLIYSNNSTLFLSAGNRVVKYQLPPPTDAAFSQKPFLTRRGLSAVLGLVTVPTVLGLCFFLCVRMRRRLWRSRLLAAAAKRRHHQEGNGNGRLLGRSSATRRIDRGQPFQALRQDESDMEDAVVSFQEVLAAAGGTDSTRSRTNGTALVDDDDEEEERPFGTPVVRDPNGLNVSLRSREA